MATILYEDRVADAGTATAEGDDLWLSLDELRHATGWELKPEGVCRDDVCVPLPRGDEGRFVRDGDGGRFNLTAFARHLGQPVVRQQTPPVWAFGRSAEVRRAPLAQAQAPDFTLPDLEGRLYSLSDYRGKKVLLVSWASW